MLTTFYPPYHLGGDAIHVYYLSNELAKLGHEVHVIFSIDAYYLNRRVTPTDDFPNSERIFLHPLKSRLGILAPLLCGYVGSSYPLANEALKLVKEIKPDVIHHHNIAGFGPSVLTAEAPKVLYTAHDYWLICPRNNLLKPNKTFCNNRQNCSICCLQWKRPPQLWRYTNVLNKELSHIDTIIAPSNYMSRTLIGAGVSRPVVTIPNFVPEIENVSESTNNSRYFLYVGLLEEHKGILNLVNVFCRNANKIGANLLVVGSGSLEGKLHELIAQNSCEDRIKILGHIDDKKALTSLFVNALALIIPSIWPENAPLVALEALSCGTPIITSDKGGLPEITEKLDHDLIFKAENDLELAELLLRYDKTRYLSQKIKLIFLTNYSPNGFINKYQVLLK